MLDCLPIVSVTEEFVRALCTLVDEAYRVVGTVSWCSGTAVSFFYCRR